jgi:hypothetical protein
MNEQVRDRRRRHAALPDHLHVPKRAHHVRQRHHGASRRALRPALRPALHPALLPARALHVRRACVARCVARCVAPCSCDARALRVCAAMCDARAHKQPLVSSALTRQCAVHTQVIRSLARSRAHMHTARHGTARHGTARIANVGDFRRLECGYV